MPIGIPKIPYLVPGDDDASWTDLYNRIYQQRLLFLGQEINSEMSNHLTGLMVFLSMEDKDRDIFLFINSPGGGIISGMAVFDIMNAVEADVQTIGVGLVASMASVLLLGGEITKRLAFPHARVMMHQPASSFYDGISGESVMELKEFEKMRDSIVKIYVQRTGKPPWQISRDIGRDFFMTAEEAKDYGIIDIVAEGHYF